MENIKLSLCKKIVYYFGWYCAILSLGWIVALYINWQQDDQLKEKRKGYLTKSYQKFIFVWGCIYLIGLFLGLLIMVLI